MHKAAQACALPGAWLAEQEGVSQADVIRKAISAYVPESGGDRNFRLVGSGSGPGDSVADIPEDELPAGFGPESE